MTILTHYLAYNLSTHENNYVDYNTILDYFKLPLEERKLWKKRETKLSQLYDENKRMGGKHHQLRVKKTEQFLEKEKI